MVLPPGGDYQWLLDQPDEALNDTVNLNNELQAEATIGEPFMVHSPVVRETITRELTRRIGTLTPELFDELQQAVDEEWGTDTDNWKTVNLFKTVLAIVARSANRVFVGVPLCRNKNFTYSALSYSATLFPCSILIRHFPRPLRPLVSKVITVENQMRRRAFIKFVKPEAKRRMDQMGSVGSEKASAKHNDFLQWLIDSAVKSGNTFNQDPYIIAQRMIFLQFSTIYPISGTSTNAMYDLLSQPDAESLIASIRTEINEVTTVNDGNLSKKALGQLHKIDSAIKESLRLAPVVAFGSGRHVMTKGGLTTPASKTYLPEGSTVAIPSYAIHQDPANYEDAAQYKAFRFAEGRAEAEAEIDGKKEATAAAKAKAPGMAFVTTSQKFTSFGHGRLACPGRFFAGDVIKLMLAYMIQNYDFELGKERPKRVWAGPFDVPPMTSTIRIKRRAKA